MKEEIIKNLSGIIEYVKQGTDFIKEQAPLYVQELIKYYYAISLTYIISCSVILILCASYMFWIRVIQEDSSEYEVLCIIVGLIATIFLAYNIETFIQIQLAPRVFVVEKLMSICK